ncbi:MAG: hypothetical protein OK474_12435 [Thaumarchaeota archaeon]|nr:hypothetical protein [Nitrososphaerota archaeon]
MQGSTAVKLGLVALLAAAPCYVVERITEYFFLNGPTVAFYDWSGDRTPIFISLILIGAIASGYLTKSITAAIAAYNTGIVVLLSLFYTFCIPEVCYSTGTDGLEPLRLGYFFTCLCIGGISLGNYTRTRVKPRGLLLYILSAVTISVTAYYPVVFTIAGTRLIAPLDPLPVVAIVALPSIVFAGRITQANGWKLGMAIPVLASLILIAMTTGIARQYLPQISSLVSLILVDTTLAAGIGRLVVRRSRSPAFASISRHLVLSNRLLYVTLVLLFSTAAFLPDASAAVTPQRPGVGASSPYAIGPTVYAGGFATQAIVRPEAVSVTVSFEGTNASNIETDNFLSAGMGVHSPHCCVDGIDFSYRFDVYLFHDGSQGLVATAWEICDWNMACGGHSWQEMMFFSEEQVNVSISSNLHLFLEWKNRTVFWSFSVDQGPASDFTSFTPISQNNPYFIVGTQGNIPATPLPPRPFFPNSLLSILTTPSSPGFYFFQYGMMSSYPIGHPGWSVSFICPSYLVGGNWECLNHSDTLQGDQSYWKVIWRWGESYRNVAARTNGAATVTFSYSSSTMPSFSPLW